MNQQATWPWWTPTMVNVDHDECVGNSNDQRVHMYLSILHLLLLLQLQLQSNAFLFVCLFRSTVYYQHQQCQHACYQEHCHDVLPPRNMNTPATTTTRTRWQSWNANNTAAERGPGTGNSPLASSTTLTRLLSRSLPTHSLRQVQQELHSSSNRNAIRQWQ